MKISMPMKPPTNHNAFTLIEVLLVVVILGILSGITIPKFVSTFATSRNNSIQMNLHRMRGQLELYRQQHTSYPTLLNFTNQMTMASNQSGITAAIGTPGFSFGPYIHIVPNNPNTGSGTVGMGAIGTSDWYYNETNGMFQANDSVASFAY